MPNNATSPTTIGDTSNSLFLFLNSFSPKVNPPFEDLFYVAITLILYFLFASWQSRKAKQCAAESKLVVPEDDNIDKINDDYDRQPPAVSAARHFEGDFHEEDGRMVMNDYLLQQKPQKQKVQLRKQLQLPQQKQQKPQTKLQPSSKHGHHTPRPWHSPQSTFEDKLVAARQQRYGKADNSPSSNDRRTLLIAYMPWEATEEDVEAMFSLFVSVKRVRLVVDRVSHRPRCFGFVKFSTHEDAKNALMFAHMGSITLPDLRGHVWHLKAEWASTEMIVDDNQKEYAAKQRRDLHALHHRCPGKRVDTSNNS